MKKVLIYILAMIHFLFFFFCLYYLPDFDCCLGLLFTFILSFSIVFFLLYKKTIDIFEPIVLYSCFNLLTPIVQVYLVFKSSNNVFLNAQPLIHSFSYMFNLACFMNLLGYYSCLFGYFSMKKIGCTKKVFIQPSQNILTIFIVFFISLAVLNFSYNMRKIGGSVFNNPALLYLAISDRSESGTTIFYNFAVFALYLYISEKKKTRLINEIFLLFLAFIMVASKLRIFLSLTIILVFVGMKYEDSNNTKKNKLFIIIILVLLCIGCLFYYFRVSMSLSILGEEASFRNFAESFGYFAFDKGNTPNIALQMLLYDRWDNYLLGKTFIVPLVSWLGVDLHNFIPAIIIKQTFFSHIQGGNLPVTGVGEFFMNFGYLGIIWGMFLFGVFGRLIYTFFYKAQNRILRIIGLFFAISFYMLFPKGESNNLGLFQPICILLIYISFDFICISSKNNIVSLEEKNESIPHNISSSSV